MASSTLQALLSTLTESLKSASNSLPDPSTIAPPAQGISLLDTKNELFLTYLQNLVFLIIIKLRDARGASTLTEETESSESPNATITAEVVKKLVELRVYLEKGVKPLESRLRYQIDKVVRAADDSAAGANGLVNGAKIPSEKSRPSKTTNDSSGSESASDSDASSEEDEDAAPNPIAIDPLAYRPNLAAFSRPSEPSSKPSSSSKEGIYRPPRINPVAPPTTTSSKEARSKPVKSRTLDQFINEELSTAPMAEPTIGSTSAAQGRRSLGRKEREEARDRTRYEEENLVRLPEGSMKEKRMKERARGGGDVLGGYGGEDWVGLGAGADRVVAATKGRSSGVLDRSRKRRSNDEGGAGARMGESFEKRRKGVESRMNRRRN